MKFFILVLVLGQLLSESNAGSLRLADKEFYDHHTKTLTPFPIFPSETERPPRQGAVRRFNGFGPPCGHLGSLLANDCVCCGVRDDKRCYEEAGAIDFCELSEIIDRLQISGGIKPFKVPDHRLPSDFPDIKKFYSF